ncbi:MAG: hypothetical protein R2911_10505 [Caldilineaceae bacterium]
MGKARLASLSTFRSLRQDFVDIIYDDFGNSAALHDQLWRKIGAKFYRYFGSTRHLNNFDIIYEYGKDKRIVLSLKTDKSLNISFENYDFYQSLFSGRITKLIDEVQRYAEQNSAYARRVFNGH